MNLKIVLTCGLFLFALKMNSQNNTLSRTEAYSYTNTVMYFLKRADKNIVTKSELVIMLLETGDSGRVTKIHLMAENQEANSLYGVLTKMRPWDFKPQPKLSAFSMNKTVILPVYSLNYSGEKSNYMDQMRMPSCPFITEDMSGIVKESYGFIQVNGFSHVVQVPDYIKSTYKFYTRNTYLNEKDSSKQSKNRLAILLQKNSPKGFITDTVMMKLQAEHDLVIGYSSYNYAWDTPDKYNLLLLKGKKWTAVQYDRAKKHKRDEEVFNWLDTIPLNKLQIDSVLKQFERNSGWTLNCLEDLDESNCPHLINEQITRKNDCVEHQSNSIKLIMMTKTNLQTAAFNNPMGFEQCCPGWSDRARLLAITKPIAQIFGDKYFRQ